MPDLGDEVMICVEPVPGTYKPFVENYSTSTINYRIYVQGTDPNGSRFDISPYPLTTETLTSTDNTDFGQRSCGPRSLDEFRLQ